MRILIVGATGPSALETFYARAFARLGLFVRQYDLHAPVRRVQKSRVLNRLTWPGQHVPVGRALRDFLAPDAHWDLVFVVKGLFLSPRALRAARLCTPRAQWFCFHPDSPFDPGRSASSQDVRDCIPLYDCYFIWSHGLEEPLLRAQAKCVRYLPFGYDKDEHQAPAQRDLSLANRLTFVGSYDTQRAEVLSTLAHLPLQVFGGGWEKLSRFSALRQKVVPGAIFGEGLRRVVSSSLASINILRPQNAGSHNMRTFEVPAMGGVMLTNRTEEQQAFFPEGRACLMYGDNSELRQMAEALLAGKVDTERMRAAALGAAEAHSYDARARAIVDFAYRRRA